MIYWKFENISSKTFDINGPCPSAYMGYEYIPQNIDSRLSGINSSITFNPSSLLFDWPGFVNLSGFMVVKN